MFKTYLIQAYQVKKKMENFSKVAEIINGEQKNCNECLSIRCHLRELRHMEHLSQKNRRVPNLSASTRAPKTAV